MAATKAPGFKVPCPHCGATEGITVAVHDLTLTCAECGERVTIADLQSLIDDAQRLIRWLQSAATA
jgi:uncharacterized protein (DUF983 family)